MLGRQQGTLPDATGQETSLLGYRHAADLDRALGDPRDPDGPGWDALCRRDAAGTVTPLASGPAADALRLAFVPAAAGGTLRGLDETIMLARVAARRDATVMPATMFGITATTAVLIGGTAAQRAEVVGHAAAGRTVAFAVSEPEHDDDPQAGECALVPDGDGGHRLRGHKWRVGLGPDTAAVLVLARTGGRGPAAFSLVLLRAGALAAARAGDRGADGWRGVAFADLHFDDVAVPAADVIGGVDGVGRGLELMLRAMQPVRVTSTAAPLGATDTALALAAEHGSTGPWARRELGTAAVAAAAAQVHALVCARALHTLPAQQSVGSSAVKRVVTELSGEVFDRCADVLGFSAALAGPFATARRDLALARVVDTDPGANLHLLGQQVRRLALSRRAAPAAATDPAQGTPTTDRATKGSPTPLEADPALAATVTLDAPLPALDPGATALAGRGEALVDGLPALVAALRAGGPDALAGRAQDVVADLDAVLDAAAATPSATDLADLAHRFAFLHAAAAALHVWWAQRGARLYGRPVGDTHVTAAVVDLCRARAAGTRAHPDPGDVAAVVDTLGETHRAGRLFGVVPIPAAESEHSESESSESEHREENR